MSTLLLRLAAPIQSWGVNAKFERRTTERAPTKSAVIGLTACALGRSRNEMLDDLQKLRFGSRIDQQGVLLKDYHTAKREKNDSSYVTNRYYLADAVFLVGLEGDETLLEMIHQAINHPVFPLFLGRRSCPPEGRIVLGIRRNKSLIESLQQEPWLGKLPTGKTTEDPLKLQMFVETEENSKNGSFIQDVPLSFHQGHRRYGFRRVTEMMTLVKSTQNPYFDEPSTSHNAMMGWEG